VCTSFGCSTSRCTYVTVVLCVQAWVRDHGQRWHHGLSRRCRPCVDVGGGNNVSAVSLGNSFTCALLEGPQAVKCWGSNTNGQVRPQTFRASLLCEAKVCTRINVALRPRPRDSFYIFFSCIFPLPDQLGLGHTNNIGDNELPSTSPTVNVGGPGTFRILCPHRFRKKRKNILFFHFLRDVVATVCVCVYLLAWCPVAAVDCGYFHVCVVLINGSVVCWGRSVLCVYLCCVV